MKKKERSGFYIFEECVMDFLSRNLSIKEPLSRDPFSGCWVFLTPQLPPPSMCSCFPRFSTPDFNCWLSNSLLPNWNHLNQACLENQSLENWTSLFKMLQLENRCFCGSQFRLPMQPFILCVNVLMAFGQVIYMSPWWFLLCGGL